MSKFQKGDKVRRIKTFFEEELGEGELVVIDIRQQKASLEEIKVAGGADRRSHQLWYLANRFESVVPENPYIEVVPATKRLKSGFYGKHIPLVEVQMGRVSIHSIFTGEGAHRGPEFLREAAEILIKMAEGLEGEKK